MNNTSIMNDEIHFTLKGGCWILFIKSCRAINSNHIPPELPYVFYGFRLIYY